jgi:hypothetical protein
MFTLYDFSLLVLRKLFRELLQGEGLRIKPAVEQPILAMAVIACQFFKARGFLGNRNHVNPVAIFVWALADNHGMILQSQGISQRIAA